MTDAEIAELEAELRLHKEERLRLRALEMRLSRELETTKAKLSEALDFAEEGWAYVDKYYRAKWDYAGRLAALRGQR
jgi:hypothetical protein